MDERLAADARRSILERVGGNPLYAEEIVRLLLDRGLLQRVDGVLRLKVDEQVPLPDTVQATIAARLDTLPREQKALLCDASVLGESFTCEGASAVAGGSVSSVASVIASLCDRQFLRRVRLSAGQTDARYLFWHAIVRDVAYRQLPMQSRVDLHALAARWLEAASGSRVDEISEVLAHHFATAFELACLTGRDQQAALLLDPALRFLAKAGDRVIHLNVGPLLRKPN